MRAMILECCGDMSGAVKLGGHIHILNVQEHVGFAVAQEK